MTSSPSTNNALLITALADRLQTTPEAAESVLEDITADIRERLDRDGVYHWTGIGVFRQDGGILAFHPAEELAASVNHRYADLIPLAIPDEPVDDLPDVAEVPVDSEMETPLEEPAHSATPQKGSIQTNQDVSLSPTVPERSNRSTKRSRTALREQERRPAWPWAVAILFVVLLGGALLFFGLYDGSLDQLRAALSTPPPAADARVAPDDPPALPQEAPAASVVEEEATGDSPQSTQAEDNPVSPTPATIDPTLGGWTIVVGSFQIESEAETVRASFVDQLEDKDLPLGILEAPPGQTRFRFRVAAGQFQTQRQAEQSMRDLDTMLPDDAWIMRIGS